MEKKLEVIKVAITDDHNLICEGMEKIINAHNDMKMIFTSNSCKDLLYKLQLCHDDQPDILLLDIEMPDVTGIDTLIKLKKQYPKLKVVMLSYHDEPHYIMHLIEKGARGYIQKNSLSTEVLKTIRKVYSDGNYFSPEIIDLMTERLSKDYRKNEKFNFKNKQLTRSEIRILELVCQEMTTAEIADFCNISFRTVECHRYSILKKAGVDNSVGLVKYAIANGFYTPEIKKDNN